jgi:hypothetical protein
MRKRILGALCLSLLLSTRSPGQETEKQERSQTLAEVRFGDGSLVRMTLLQEDLEVMTRYGKLTIPVGEIRKIDFGLHVPSGLDQQITTSIKLLGSEVYREREGATKDLVVAGHWAYPLLQKASRSTDQETAQRAHQVLKQIADKVSPDLLRLREEDVIHTREFTVVGRIVSPSLKAQSAHFGEMALKLSDLRTLQIRHSSNNSEVTVDASKHGSDLTQWCDTGIMVDPSLRLLLQSDGNVDLWPQGPGQYIATPKGYNTTGKGGVFMAGSLVARVGDNGKTFVVGERFEGSPGEEGRLFLQIVPSPWNNPSAGSYRVRIHTDPLAGVSR